MGISFTTCIGGTLFRSRPLRHKSKIPLILGPLSLVGTIAATRSLSPGRLRPPPLRKSKMCPYGNGVLSTFFSARHNPQEYFSISFNDFSTWYDQIKFTVGCTHDLFHFEFVPRIDHNDGIILGPARSFPYFQHCYFAGGLESLHHGLLFSSLRTWNDFRTQGYLIHFRFFYFFLVLRFLTDFLGFR